MISGLVITAIEVSIEEMQDGCKEGHSFTDSWANLLRSRAVKRGGCTFMRCSTEVPMSCKPHRVSASCQHCTDIHQVNSERQL